MRTKCIALAVMLLFLLWEVGTARALYRCMYDGVARSACCCPTQVSTRSEAAAASVAEPCCCKVERPSPASGQAQARLERTSPNPLSAPLLAVVPRVALTAPPRATFRMRAGLDPPHVRPPLILLKSSLLI